MLSEATPARRAASVDMCQARPPFHMKLHIGQVNHVENRRRICRARQWRIECRAAIHERRSLGCSGSGPKQMMRSPSAHRQKNGISRLPGTSQTPRLSGLVALFEARRLIDNGIDNGGSGSFDTRPLFARRHRAKTQRRPKEGRSEPAPISPQPEGDIGDRKRPSSVVQLLRQRVLKRQSDDARILNQVNPVHFERRAIDEAAIDWVDRQLQRVSKRLRPQANRMIVVAMHENSIRADPPANP
jgi:hypothetical protein